MTDHLTQLQDCFDQLAMQLFASMRYINEHHPRPSVDARHAPTTPGGAQTNGTNVIVRDADDAPEEDTSRQDSPETFSAALQEMARDLVAKEQEIEGLVVNLPGRGRTVEEQEADVVRLNRELSEMDAVLEEAAREKEELLGLVEAAIWKISRY